MKVVFTKKSQSDLRRITRGLVAYDPQLARRLVDDLREKALDIGDFPERFQEVPKRPGSGLRRRVVGRYLILYHIDKDRVIVDNFFHGAQDVRILG